MTEYPGEPAARARLYDTNEADPWSQSAAETAPDEYIAVFQRLSGDGASLSWTQLRQLLDASGLNSVALSRIVDIVLPGQDETRGIGRAEFDLAMALVAIAQQDGELSLQAVHARRHALPVPHLNWPAPPPAAEPSREGWGAGADAWTGPAAQVSIAIVPKEGVLMFRHVNYRLTSTGFKASVVRRYSDFVWLHEFLHKRYPFRRIPLLPPKRLTVNGYYFAADPEFLERRRKGLLRFSNTLLAHPTLAREQLVSMFFSNPTEVALWKKHAASGIKEESSGQQRCVLPPNLDKLLETTRAGVNAAADIYIALCQMIERLESRQEGIAALLMRFSLSLRSLVELHPQVYAMEDLDLNQVNAGLLAASKHLSYAQAICEDEAHCYGNTLLEDLRQQRDVIVAMRVCVFHAFSY